MTRLAETIALIERETISPLLMQWVAEPLVRALLRGFDRRQTDLFKALP